MSVKFIHFSDSHLGASDSITITHSAREQREKDKYTALKLIVDRIIKEKPDFVIHTGDFFHRASPGNAPLVSAIEQLGRLNTAKIPLYMIAGNHDFPKVTTQQPIHQIFKHLKNIKIFFDEAYSVVDLGNCTLHALPHINSKETFNKELEKITTEGRKSPNILMMHLSMPIAASEEIELGGGVFPAEKLELLGKFDYVALGHWHKFLHLKQYGNVFYSGAPDKMNLSEINHTKGFISVEIEDSGKVNAQFVPLNTREIIEITITDCDKKNEGYILKEISDALKEHEIKDSVIVINLKDLSKASYYATRVEEIEKITAGCLDLRLTRATRADEFFDDDGEVKPIDSLFEDLRRAFSDDELYLRFFDLTNKLLEEIETERAQNVD
ncbi:MAG: exonuclease SbcCD subunit D [Ignavibacteriales bacterium]|nr:MAG: exonuclease SbcCD subunit D [Ignavibacteriaceae bacterium]MBW7872714.1 exonuclease SbcCD subunit D [Ignavibacteria bacterium]MCZ2143434.1 exonuclease SbcCD subunit D [Ignavibacteriales bacterium]OQY73267.1 MAG: hypothetical protein B6D45_08310 [Ignavibacteriales bacterium UTCHB3]MBV6444312.1 3',5'-cyclic adenosine monophosphate phosphodiesterase CpdA [Ignavibacteriaceae bacterium]